MTVDLVIKNGKLVTPEGIFEAGIAVDNEKIVAICKDPFLPTADQIVDATGKHVLPGAVEPHFHFGIYHPYQSDLKSETAAAICGGATTVMNMWFASVGEPLIPSYVSVFQKYVDPIKILSYADIAMCPMISSYQHLNELGKLVDLGVSNFKFFMHRETQYSVTGEQERDEAGREMKPTFSIGGADNGLVYLSLEAIRAFGGVAIFHSENTPIAYALYPRYKERKDPFAYNESRPPFLEELDIRLVSRTAEVTGCPVVFAHISIGEAIDIANEYRNRGNRVFLEACLHHLTIDDRAENLKRGTLAGKTNPPSRKREHIEKLWWGISKGFIDSVGSDAGRNVNKFPADNDIWKTTLGGPYLEELLPILLSEGVNRGRLTLERLVEVRSLNNAIIHGMYPQKGTIEVGSDADLVLVDLKRTKKLTPEIMHGGSGYSIYEDWKLTGWPVLTVLRGKIMMEDGQLVEKEGVGRYLPCTPPFREKNQIQNRTE